MLYIFLLISLLEKKVETEVTEIPLMKGTRSVRLLLVLVLVDQILRVVSKVWDER
jgi:hypothetical protein